MVPLPVSFIFSVVPTGRQPCQSLISSTRNKWGFCVDLLWGFKTIKLCECLHFTRIRFKPVVPSRICPPSRWSILTQKLSPYFHFLALSLLCAVTPSVSHSIVVAFWKTNYSVTKWKLTIKNANHPVLVSKGNRGTFLNVGLKRRFAPAVRELFSVLKVTNVLFAQQAPVATWVCRFWHYLIR